MSKYSAHPALQTEKANEQSNARKQRYPRSRTSAMDNVIGEFRTSRRALNVLSCESRTVRAGDVVHGACPWPPGLRQLDEWRKALHKLFVWPVFSN